jgi:hypothetical protein
LKIRFIDVQKNALTDAIKDLNRAIKEVYDGTPPSLNEISGHGMRRVVVVSAAAISGEDAFHLYRTYTYRPTEQNPYNQVVDITL